MSVTLHPCNTRAGPDPLSPGESQVAMCYLRNTGTGLHEKQLGPIASRGSSIRLSVKYVDDISSFQGTPLLYGIFWICACILIIFFVTQVYMNMLFSFLASLMLFILFIYTIFQEGDTFGMKAILPCGPLNIRHMKTNYIQIYK